GEEMHRSAGNAFDLQDLFKQHEPLVIRFFILGSHYRSPLDFDEQALAAAKSGLERLHTGVRAIRNRLAARPPDGGPDDAWDQKIAQTRAKFIAEMDDDFNTATAIAVLFEFTKDVNTLL